MCEIAPVVVVELVLELDRAPVVVDGCPVGLAVRGIGEDQVTSVTDPLIRRLLGEVHPFQPAEFVVLIIEDVALGIHGRSDRNVVVVGEAEGRSGARLALSP